MKIFFRRIEFFCFFILQIIIINFGMSEELPKPPFNSGYQVHNIQYKREGQEKELTIAVWYPTLFETKLYLYGNIVKGNVSFNALPCKEKGPYPLLVFSHGYGGSGIGISFLAEKLASYGWVVVSPDHNDKYSVVRILEGLSKEYDPSIFLKNALEIASSDIENRKNFLYRLLELKAVIDWIVINSPYKDIINKERIAVGGHSLGGFSALGISGTIKEYYDHRIKAILLFSTGVSGHWFTDDEISQVKIPSMLFLGQLERGSLRGRNMSMIEIAEKLYKNLPPPKYFLEVRGANHLSFSNNFSKKSKDNLNIFNVINKYSIAFLEKYVAGKDEYDQILNTQDPLLTNYKKDF